jgi:DNA-binding XRE family transcriptional regulator
MMKKNKLIEARNKKGYTQDYMAATLSMDISSYSRKEQGKIKIANHEWKQLSEILETPVEDIYESDESMMFVFNDHATGNGNIVTNYTIPQSMWESQKKYIEKMEEENQNLKEKIRLIEEDIFKMKNTLTG